MDTKGHLYDGFTALSQIILFRVTNFSIIYKLKSFDCLQ